jgi:glycosyltransferase involved in cell wall biosynthesis
MPSLNSRGYIAEAIESAFTQQCDDMELLVQDGGSTDGTHEIIRRFDDPRVKLVVEPDRSQADALNKAIARATGEWIVWLNADDLLAPSAFAVATPVLDRGQDDLVVGDFAYIDGGGNVVRRLHVPQLERRRLLTHGCYAFSGAIFFHRTIFDRWRFDDRLRYAMDYDFYLRVSPHVRTSHVPDVLAYFRVHPESNTSTATWGILRETTGTRVRHGALSPRLLVPATLNQLKQGADLLSRPLRRSEFDAPPGSPPRAGANDQP